MTELLVAGIVAGFSSGYVLANCCTESLTGLRNLCGISWFRGQERHPQEWLFAALAYGRRDLVEKGDPDIHWNEMHRHFGSPLHAIGAGGISLELTGWPRYEWSEESNAIIKDLLALFEFALRRGADPALACPRQCAGSVRFVARCEGEVIYDLKEIVGGRSAISLWLAFSQRARELDNASPYQLPLASSFFDAILSLLLRVLPKHGTARAQRPELATAEVPEATIELWRRLMEQEETTDLVLRCPDGDVRMHTVVAMSASRVLSAMLRWPSPEPEQRSNDPHRMVVVLEDRQEVVEAWRLLVYTGLPPPAGVSTELLLDVLALSHRWQDHLLEKGLLTAALARRVVDRDSCGVVLDAALVRNIPELRSACLAFARESREVQQLWESGGFSVEASRQLDAALAETPTAAPARRPSPMMTVRSWDL